MIESILETPPFAASSLTGTSISFTAGANALTGIGTNFDPELSVDDIVTAISDDGTLVTNQVASITDDTNAVMVNNWVKTGTAITTFLKITPESDYVLNNINVAKMPIVQADGLSNNFNLLKDRNSSRISPNEGILIKSVFMRTPYQHTLADTTYNLRFATRENNGISPGGTNVPSQLGEGNGILKIYAENTEIPVNIYLPPDPDAVANNVPWEIMVSFRDSVVRPADRNPSLGSLWDNVPTISMVNMPTVLDGLICPIIVGIRIQHANVPLVV